MNTDKIILQALLQHLDNNKVKLVYHFTKAIMGKERAQEVENEVWTNMGRTSY